VHSIVVLGDIRLHNIVGSKEIREENSELWGGAYLMQNAIRAALKITDEADGDSGQPSAFFLDEITDSHAAAYLVPRTAEVDASARAAEGDCLYWDQIVTSVDASDMKKRVRLKRKFDQGHLICPEPTVKFHEALINGGFEKLAERENNEVPDIVVFDDLGLKLSGEDLAKDIDNHYRDGQLKFSISEAQEFAEHAKKLLSVDHYMNSEEMDYRTARQRAYAAAIAILIKRLEFGVEASKERNPDRLEPVLLMSWAVGLHRKEPANLPPLDRPGSVWKYVYDKPELRKRAIVILDAKDLRRELSISSGLSWERTAQDCIVELGRNDKGRKFLQFGHLIVRFGLTGALLVTNHEDSNRSFTLCYDPDRDDTTWTHPVEVGEVLGSSALFVATIAESLTKICSQRGGNLNSSNLKSVLSNAISLALSRVQQHLAFGYGATDDPSEWRLLQSEKVSDDSDTPHRNLHRWFHESIFERPLTLGSEVATGIGRAIQQTQVPLVRSRLWSILMQSTQSRASEIAQSIVLRGTKVTLNTIHDPVNQFVDAVLNHFLVSVEETQQKLAAQQANRGQEQSRENKRSGKEHASQSKGFTQEQLISELAQLTAELVKCVKEVLEHKDAERLLGSHFKDRCKDKLHWLLVCTSESIVKSRSGEEVADAMPLGRLVNEIQSYVAAVSGEKQSPESGGNATLLGGAITVLSDAFAEIVGDATQFQVNATLLGDTIGMISDCIAGSVGNVTQFQGNATLLFGTIGIHRNENYASVGNVAEVTAELGIGEDLYENQSENDDLSKGKVKKKLLEEIRTILLGSLGGIEVDTDPVGGPILRLGKLAEAGGTDKRLVIVDRQEVEGVRAVKRQIENHLRQIKEKKIDRPLSIAVFGPPGTGKSLSVTKIIEMLSNDNKIQIDTHNFNIAQWTSSNQLNEAFKKIETSIAAQKIPVAFFDEFDASFGDKSLGWLKYFLSPMEDGKFDRHEVKNAIFVFAGGTSPTFSEFSLENRSKTDDLWVQFSKAKGPDFVSRISVHLNIVGINPLGLDDETYLIRRAIVIRHLLAMEQNLKDHEPARIDPDMIRAYLHVPEYRHGARSMRMLLQMCMTNDSQREVSKSEVPPLAQLNMQVDGKSFLDLIANVAKTSSGDK